jgi:hypothetical protein
MDTKRAKAASPGQVQEWIDHLQRVFAEYKIKPEMIANADETNANLQDIEKRVVSDGESTVLIPGKLSRLNLCFQTVHER